MPFHPLSDQWALSYNNLKSLLDLDNVEDLCLTFTFTENAFGVNRDVELVEGGAEIDVTNENLPAFLEANFKYHLMYRVKPQLAELLLGFYDVIPEPLMTMFDFQELELLMSGLPEIDVDDWMANTLYQGQFESRGAQHKSCQWFWEVVREFDQEHRAKLLQFLLGVTREVVDQTNHLVDGIDCSQNHVLQAKTIEIKHAYRQKVRRCHPDKCTSKPEDEKMALLTEYQRVHLCLLAYVSVWSGMAELLLPAVHHRLRDLGRPCGTCML